MRKFLSCGLWVLLLGACATPTALLTQWEEAEVECGEPAEDHCVALLCGDDACGFYRCEDVPGDVVLVRGLPPRPPPAAAAPAPGGGPQRNWGSAMNLPGGGEPIMVFPWYGTPRPVPPQRQLPPGRFEKHHIFPQAPELAAWFKEKGIDIHLYTLPIPRHIHQRIHNGGPRGGEWNQAWKDYKNAHPEAPPVEIFKHAGELIYRFQLLGGPIQKYN